MAATKERIQRWFKEGQSKDAHHMLVITDTYEYEDYPMYVMKNEDTRKKIKEIRENETQVVQEIYDLSLDMNVQLEEKRAYHP
jgi:predicted transcriptional regulator